MHEILVDEIGYNQFFTELEKLKQLSLSNASSGSEAYANAIGDGWHDNFAFEESMRTSRSIAAKIDKMLEEQKMLKIITPHNLGNDYINIGDSLEIEIQYSSDDIEKEKLTLTGKYKPNIDSEIKEITLNSPIGKAIYMKNIYDNNINYLVNEQPIKIKILRKL